MVKFIEYGYGEVITRWDDVQDANGVREFSCRSFKSKYEDGGQCSIMKRIL